MSDKIRGFTIDEYVDITRGVIYEVRNCLVSVIGYSELAKEELDQSHPAFPHVANVLRAGERAFATVRQFDLEFYRRRNEEREAGRD